MYFWNKFCGFVTIFFLSVFLCSAQNVKYPLSIYAKKRSTLSTTIIFPTTNDNRKVISAVAINIINPDFYAQHLGFICKKEIALEKVTKVPLRFRLGSLQQCNYLEGKK